MGKVVHTLFPRRISLADDMNSRLRKQAEKKARTSGINIPEADRHGNRYWGRSFGYYERSAEHVHEKVEEAVERGTVTRVRQMVHDRWSGLTAETTGSPIGKWLNKYSFQALYNKGNRSLRKMRKHLDSGIWVNLCLAALSICFLAVDGLYLLLRGIWMEGSGTGLAADLAATSLVLAGFFLLLSAACWGARELTVEIVKVRNRNASRLTS